MRSLHLLWALLVCMVLSCAPSAAEPESEAVGTTSSDLVTWFSAPRIAVAFPGGFEIHGLDATRAMWFAAVPSASADQPAGVLVARRVTGRPLGMLPPPPNGFGAPMAVRVVSDHRVLVLDAVVSPAMAGAAPAMIHEYDVRPTLVGFAATLVASRTLPLIPFTEIPVAIGPEPRTELHGIFYPLNMTAMPTGEVIVADGVGGALWVSDPTRTTFRNALEDPRLRPVPHAPIAGKGRAPGGGVRDYAFDVPCPPCVFPGVFGVAFLASTDEVVFANPSQGALWAMPRSVFMSMSDPTLKGASLRPLAAPTPGITDLVAGLDTNRFDPSDPNVYFQRVAADASSAYRNVLARVDATTGTVTIVASSQTAFDWNMAVAVIPEILPLSGKTIIASGMGQEQNNPEVNVTLGGVASYVSPTLISEVVAVH